MEILFDDPALRDAIQLGRTRRGMPEAVRLRARYMLRLLEAIPDIRTLKNWKSAGFRPGRGKWGIGQIALVDGYHFVVRLVETLNPPTITIFDIDQEPRKAAREPAHEDA